MRALVLAGVGAQAPVAGEQVVEPVDDVLGARAAPQVDSHVVESAVHVVGVRERLAPHPHHAVALVIGKDAARAELVDELRRLRGAHHGEPLAPALDDGVQGVARHEAVGRGEGVAQHYFVVAPGLDEPALLEIERVQVLVTVLGDRDDAPGDRLVEALDVEVDRRDHARGDALDAGDAGDARAQALRRTLEAREHVGEAVVAVVGSAGGVQAIERGDEHDVGRHAAKDHQGDRRRLTPHLPDLAQQLAVERTHRYQDISAGVFLRVLRSCACTLPLLR